MVELRRRKTKPSTEHDADNESDTDAMEPGSFSDGSSAPAKPAATHSKGENKLSKLKKRLIFGTLLLAFLCCIIAAGHLWTLALVRCHILSLSVRERRSHLFLFSSSHRCCSRRF